MMRGKHRNAFPAAQPTKTRMRFAFATAILIDLAGCISDPDGDTDPGTEREIPGIEPDQRFESHTFTLGSAIVNLAYGPVTSQADITIRQNDTPTAAHIEVEPGHAYMVWNPQVCEASPQVAAQCLLEMQQGNQGKGYWSTRDASNQVTLDSAWLTQMDCLTPCQLSLAAAIDENQTPFSMTFTFGYGDHALESIANPS